MVHLKSDLAEKQEIIKQFIQKESMAVSDLPLDPRVDAYVTNNFLQGTLSRLLAFDETLKKYVVVKVDSSGNLKTTASVTNNIYGNLSGAAKAIAANVVGGLSVDPGGRDLTIDPVFTNENVPAGASITHVGVDLQHAAKITILLASLGSFTIRPQISDDNADWYDVKTEADGDLSWAVSNEKIAARLDSAAKFFRIFCTNDGATAQLLTARILGQG